MTALGSSKYMDTQVPFSGILSSDPANNPGAPSLSYVVVTANVVVYWLGIF